MRTLIAGGGTGGHLTPALAVAEALRRADPSAEILVVGRRNGVAERLVTAAGLRLETIDVSGIDTSSVVSVGRAVCRLPGATVAALRLLRRFGADVVVGTAGYVCVPVVTAAAMARVPVVLLEQNARPGRAIGLLSRRARVVATSFEETAAELPWARTVLTGNPIREGIASRAPGPARDRCRHLLVMGGSQGARRINRAVAGCAADLLERHGELTITHQTGALDEPWVAEAAAALPGPLRSRWTVTAFVDDVAGVLREADLAVMRAGGSSLAECSAMGRPMILVPYPHARGHQLHNALPYVRAGAALLVDDGGCTPDRLRDEVGRLLDDPRRWRSMAAASLSMARPGAAARVAELVVQFAGAGRAAA